MLMVHCATFLNKSLGEEMNCRIKNIGSHLKIHTAVHIFVNNKATRKAIMLINVPLTANEHLLDTFLNLHLDKKLFRVVKINGTPCIILLFGQHIRGKQSSNDIRKRILFMAFHEQEEAYERIVM